MLACLILHVCADLACAHACTCLLNTYFLLLTLQLILILIILLNKTAYADIIQGSEPQSYNKLLDYLLKLQ